MFDITEDLQNVEQCEVTMSRGVVKTFKRLVKHNYWYQLYIDDLPMWASIGGIDGDGMEFIYAHKRFLLGYNKDRVRMSLMLLIISTCLSSVHLTHTCLYDVRLFIRRLSRCE